MARLLLGLVLAIAFVGACSTDHQRLTTPPVATPTQPMATPTPPDATPTQLVGVSLADVAARAAHSATSLPGGGIFVAGGCVVDGCGVATEQTFLVASDLSSAARGPQMATPRDGHTATLTTGGAIVLAGGFSGEGQGALDSVEVFDPATDELQALSPLSTARGGHAAAPLANGSVLIVGGWIASHTYTSSAEVVDPSTGLVSTAAALPYAADALAAIALSDGRVLVTGGVVSAAGGTNQAAIYDPTADAWQSVGPMLSPRFKHTSVLLADGRVLVIGGTTDDQKILQTTEIFDPSTGAFSAGPALTEPRYKMTGGAVTVSGGQVLIGGGGRSIEILDVGRGSSRIVDTFGRRGSFTTVTASGTAAWLVLGGYDDHISLLREFRIVTAADLHSVAASGPYPTP